MSGEAAIKSDIRLAVGRTRHARLFNNPVGDAWQGRLVERDEFSVTLAAPRRITFGLMPGSADLVGWTSLVITPAMVGSRVAVFTSGEVKGPGAPAPSTEQLHWRNAVHLAGGFAGILHNVGDALRLVRA